METMPSTIPSPRIGASFVSNPAYIRTNMDAGNVRQRRRFMSTFSTINVEWTMSQQQFLIFENFFYSSINAGGDWFNIQLPTPYQFGTESARFIDPYQATSISQGEDTIWTITAQLEVRNLTRSAQLVDLINAGIDPNGFILAIDRLKRFVNETQPNQYPWDIGSI